MQNINRDFNCYFTSPDENAVTIRKKVQEESENLVFQEQYLSTKHQTHKRGADGQGLVYLKLTVTVRQITKHDKEQVVQNLCL